MGILHLLKRKRKKQFVSEINFSTNRGRQSHLAVEKLVRLREANVEEDDMLKIDYSFCTDTVEKAQELIKALQYMDHDINKISDSKKGVLIVKGKSIPVKMMHEVLRKWALDMCDLGQKYDCNFDGWEIENI